MPNTKNDNEVKVRCAFDLTKDEAEAICEMRCEPKPSTAAAQIVRMAIKSGGTTTRRLEPPPPAGVGKAGELLRKGKARR